MRHIEAVVTVLANGVIVHIISPTVMEFCLCSCSSVDQINQNVYSEGKWYNKHNQFELETYTIRIVLECGLEMSWNFLLLYYNPDTDTDLIYCNISVIFTKVNNNIEIW